MIGKKRACVLSIFVECIPASSQLFFFFFAVEKLHINLEKKLPKIRISSPKRKRENKSWYKSSVSASAWNYFHDLLRFIRAWNRQRYWCAYAIRFLFFFSSFVHFIWKFLVLNVNCLYVGLAFGFSFCFKALLITATNQCRSYCLCGFFGPFNFYLSIRFQGFEL